MTLSEIKSEFEILFEDLATNGSKGLDSYEKSVCMTYAQENLALSLAEANKLDELLGLISIDTDISTIPGVYPNSLKFGHLNTIKVLDRWVTGAVEKQISLTEIFDTTIKSLYSAAYKYPPKNVGYMIYTPLGEEILLPLNFGFVNYNRRVVNYPTPIIIEALTGTDTINGLTAPTVPILHEEYHRKLVELAVNFAIKTYVGQPEQEVPQQQQGQ